LILKLEQKKTINNVLAELSEIRHL